MKQVIDGKIYNTATATLIDTAANGLGSSDFRHYEERLFKTKKGRYFLEGGGGPMTRWAECSGNMTSGGCGIQKMSSDEALEWCEAHHVASDTITLHFDLEEA